MGFYLRVGDAGDAGDAVNGCRTKAYNTVRCLYVRNWVELILLLILDVWYRPDDAHGVAVILGYREEGCVVIDEILC